MLQLRKIALLMPCFLFLECRESKKEDFMPFEITKRMHISSKCDLLAFSTNSTGFFVPEIMSGYFSGRPKMERLKISLSQNSYAESISCDCRFLSMVVEDPITELYTIKIYDLRQQKMLSLNLKHGLHYNNSAFSPVANTLAFLVDGKLGLIFNIGQRVYFPDCGQTTFKNLTWSNAGKFLILEDHSSNIWRYNLRKKVIICIWKSPAFSGIDKNITPSTDSEEEFYFNSDHASKFTQIYKYGKGSVSQATIASPFDKVLLRRPVSNKGLYYKINVKGRIYIQRVSDSGYVDIFPQDGVVYDYFPSNSAGDIFLYSNVEYPASIMTERNKRISDILFRNKVVRSGNVVPIYNREGMVNIVHLPFQRPKGWLVWLHGGPHEQFSIRFNPYVMRALKSGLAVVILNYPGSTGAGNDYEMRLADGPLLSTQVKTIRRDILEIRNKYPDFKKYTLLGVSYGSIVMSSYANLYPNEITKLIDFSGLNDVPYPKEIPLLYIYGEHDYSLDNPTRYLLLQDDKKRRYVDFLILNSEAHSIKQKHSMLKISEKIISFLDTLR